MKKSILSSIVINILALFLCLVMAIVSIIAVEMIVGAPFINWVDNCLGISFVCNKYYSDPLEIKRATEPGGFSTEVMLLVLVSVYYLIFRKFIYRRMIG